MRNDTNQRIGFGAGTVQRYHALKVRADDAAEDADFDYAEACYVRAANLDPEAPDPYVGLGTIYLQTGRLSRAEWAFRLARRIAPDCAEAHGGLAMVFQRRKAYPSAFEMYLKCLELDSDNLVALLGLFQTSCQMRTFAMITRYLEEYLKNHPDDAAVLFCLATLYAREDRLDRARRVLREVVSLAPGKVEARRLLAAVEDRLAESAGADRT